MILSTLTTIWSVLDDVISSVAKPAFIAGLFWAAINWKVLPFVWHIRIFNGYLRHFYIHDRRIPPTTLSPPSPSTPPNPKPNLTIFQPTVYTTTNPPAECDWSIHKSNSTYLTDLDLARGYHMYTFCRDGFQRWSSLNNNNKQPLLPMLGGTTCTFKREIKPFAKFEVWTRVLSWDEKWIYLVSHFVKAGGVEVGGVRDQVWKNNIPLASNTTKAKTKEKGSKPKGKGSEGEVQEGAISPHVYATATSRIVLKQGRKTVRPADFFQLGGLLGEPGTKEGDAINAEIERVRLEGIGLAGSVAALDKGHELFEGVDGLAVLAIY